MLLQIHSGFFLELALPVSLLQSLTRPEKDRMVMSDLVILSVLIFFGWVGVLGSSYLHTLVWDWGLLLPATSCGLFAVGVLNINNIRDIESDKATGKNSIPVRLGREKAIRLSLDHSDHRYALRSDLHDSAFFRLYKSVFPA